MRLKRFPSKCLCPESPPWTDMETISNTVFLKRKSAKRHCAGPLADSKSAGQCRGRICPAALLLSEYRVKNLRFAQTQPVYSGGSTALTDFLGVIVSPSISQRNCCGVNERTSSALRGHWNLLSASLLYNRSQPSPSQTSPLTRSARLPQKRYRVSGT